jgi:hypothetical protein
MPRGGRCIPQATAGLMTALIVTAPVSTSLPAELLILQRWKSE